MHYVASNCVDICSLGIQCDRGTVSLAQKICGRLDLDVIMLLHIYLIPDCGGPACGGVGLVLDFSPEALLQLSASKAYSKGPFFFLVVSCGDSLIQHNDAEGTKTAAQVQPYNGRPEPSRMTNETLTPTPATLSR